MWTNEEAFSIWMTFVCQVRERVSSNRDEQRQKDIWGKDAKKSKSNPVPMKTDQKRPWLDGRRNFRLLSWTSEWLDYKLEVISSEWRMTTNFVELWDVMYWAIFDSCKLWESNKYHQTLSAKGNQCVCVCWILTVIRESPVCYEAQIFKSRLVRQNENNAALCAPLML